MSRHISVPQIVLCTKVTELHVTNNYKIIQHRYYKLLPFFLVLLAVCLTTLSVTGLYLVNDRRMSMNTEHWWNFTVRFILKYLEKIL